MEKLLVFFLLIHFPQLSEQVLRHMSFRSNTEIEWSELR